MGRRVELGAELVGGDLVGGGLEAVLRLGVGGAVVGSIEGLNVAGPKPFHTGMFGVMSWVRAM